MDLRQQLNNPKDPRKTILDLQFENSTQRKKIDSQEQKLIVQLKENLLQGIEKIDSFDFMGQMIDGLSPESVRKLATELRQEIPSLFLVLCTVSEGKPFVAIGLGDMLVNEKHMDASKIIREVVAPKIKGGGGGQKTLATAGGQDTSVFAAVIANVRALLNT
jgi:alanyl-tRNA synthetase